MLEQKLLKQINKIKTIKEKRKVKKKRQLSNNEK